MFAVYHTGEGRLTAVDFGPQEPPDIAQELVEKGVGLNRIPGDFWGSEAQTAEEALAEYKGLLESPIEPLKQNSISLPEAVMRKLALVAKKRGQTVNQMLEEWINSL